MAHHGKKLVNVLVCVLLALLHFWGRCMMSECDINNTNSVLAKLIYCSVWATSFFRQIVDSIVAATSLLFVERHSIWMNREHNDCIQN